MQTNRRFVFLLLIALGLFHISRAQVVTPVWTDTVSGTLTGIPFTITGYEDTPFLYEWDFNGPEFSCAPLDSNEQSIDYAGSSNLTINFSSPVTNLKLYMRWWRPDGYTFSAPYTLLCGDGISISNDSLIVSGWGNGIVAFTGSVTSLTITSQQSCCSHQAFLFGAGEPAFAGIHNETTPLLPVMYPNPVNDMLQFSIPGQATLTDLQGKMLLQSVTTSSINMEHLPAGIYLLHFIGANGVTVHRRIVKN